VGKTLTHQVDIPDERSFATTYAKMRISESGTDGQENMINVFLARLPRYDTKEMDYV
jgi:hypothetical protein